MCKQIALCIGNNNYEFMTKLCCAVNDANDIASKLCNLKYEVDVVVDGDTKNMCLALDEFEKKLPGCDVCLFYFAGHGFEYKGNNLLMPIDAYDGPGSYLEKTSLGLDKVINAMQAIDIDENIKTKIIIIDACRTIKESRGGSRGFVPVQTPQGTIIAFSTSPGQIAKENEHHGCYTEALISNIDRPRIPIENMFKHVREQVAAVSHGMQISWEHTSLMGTYYFNEASIQKFTGYSDDVYCDSNYNIKKSSPIGKIIEKLKTYDWPSQKEGIEQIRTIDWNNTNVNDLFVLGRNIYQAAAGNEFTAMGFISGFASLIYIPLEAKEHLLNGMAFEIYFNKDGKFRQRFKNGMYEPIISLLENDDYITSRNFIISKLYEQKDRIVYIPGSEERMDFYITLKKFNWGAGGKDCLTIDTIYYRGTEFYRADECYGKLVNYKDIVNILAKIIVAPCDMVKIESNIEEYDIDEIWISSSLLY